AREQFSGLGRGMVDLAFRRAGKTWTEDRLKGVLSRLARPSLDDVFVAVGRAELKPVDVVRALHPSYTEAGRTGARPDAKEAGWFGVRRAANLVFRRPGREAPEASEEASAIPIRGLQGDLPVRFAPDGGALPGDRIVGILTPGEGITIYPIQSPALSKFDDAPERWLDVRWDVDPDRRELFPARVAVTIANEPGALGIVAGAIGERGANIDKLRFTGGAADLRDLVIDVEVQDLQHLNDVIKDLKTRGKTVVNAERVHA
ncbi:MAG: bifunctional (p)ppGpp synthetase/guanosine-3',5'-bis(diphosphate) 3'-pyrophosphohydrolase, partial [Hyphomicrobiales bacterium]|nr:bifunctional (p)ppGpp synthetase/guanosine-3',5'-bis(diphosphate) 3'-pyrophosphohydrolase [Hyphomicrobiales bacterium]